MAKPPKGFGESLQHNKQDAKNHQKFMKQFKQSLKQGSLKNVALVNNPAGETKMSEVLEAFVDPYMDSTSNQNQAKMLFTIGITAWNIALLPKNQHKQEIENVLRAVFKLSDRQTEQDMREMLTVLVARKLALFADNQRKIMSFQLEPMGRNLHLSVASTLPERH